MIAVEPVPRKIVSDSEIIKQHMEFSYLGLQTASYGHLLFCINIVFRAASVPKVSVILRAVKPDKAPPTMLWLETCNSSAVGFILSRIQQETSPTKCWNR